MSVKTPKIDPRILELSRQMMEAKEEAERQADFYAHRYDFAALIVAITSLLVSIASLAVALMK